MDDTSPAADTPRRANTPHTPCGEADAPTRFCLHSVRAYETAAAAVDRADSEENRSAATSRRSPWRRAAHLHDRENTGGE